MEIELNNLSLLLFILLSLIKFLLLWNGNIFNDFFLCPIVVSEILKSNILSYKSKIILNLSKKYKLKGV